jgi:molybdopterin converting factor small subunit
VSVTVRLPTPLRSAIGGERSIEIEATDLASLQREIASRYPELGARVLRDGAFGRFVTVFVDGEDARFLEQNADISGVKVVEILPAMSGG